MKCDELKVYVHPIKKSITGHTSIGLAYYSKSEVDAAIDELKQKLEDAGMRERRLKRALWLASAKRAEARKNYWTCENIEKNNNEIEAIDLKIKQCEIAIMFVPKWP